MTEAILGYGSVFQTWDGAEWVALAEAAAMSLPPLSRDVIDAGHECAPGEWRQSVTGLLNAGEISVSLNFTSAEYQARFTDLSDQLIDRRIILPDGSVFPFSAHLIGLEAGLAVGEKISAVAKFKVVGEPGPLVTGLPMADGEPPALYADFSNQFYWHHNTYYDNFDDFNASVSGTFLRDTANTGELSLARSSTGEYVPVADNTPRFDYDGSGNSLGLLSEQQATNWIVNSLTMAGMGSNTAFVTPSLEQVAPYPPATVTKHIFNGSDNAVGYFSASGMSPVVSTTAIFSCWVWIPTNADITKVFLANEQTSAPWSFKTDLAIADLSKRDQWQRIWGYASSDNTGTAMPFMVLRLNCSVPGSFIYSTMWQIENGTVPTSFIPTGATTGLRQGDQYQFPASEVVGFKNDRGTLLTYNRLPYMNPITDLYREAFTVRNAAINYRAGIFKQPYTDGSGHATISNNSVSQLSGVSGPGYWQDASVVKNALAWQADDGAAYIGGVLMVADASIDPPTAADIFTVAVGANMLATAIAYWPKRVSNSELDRLTT